ncbi:hypothetical protein A2W45_01080 [Candidatus Curtissbacteria bacterium RIFCSPHIGHO2_12_41_11]|uniref:DUF304 domain-containing protein n=3 Tax=Candidatus Curtissiibacteriota TaxID=1752717 RepID=A0A1F5HS91_9BACT|nr:MAG: hypothetical protein A2Z54_00315 [Candidatus Curtissbacteria bacterium RIFCSPHIGHO2_02_39_8]OGD99343.1 MAG: hypothetical protein A2W45_01080 [Candidatus Curtissbacteria bacterium RIFCSPHIGHO2_12_41_11]OGE06865.1 MAG: hypothetical protein A2W70_01530 [Candidatus Curtissbacteria bacterium RIFCSPLOWO2_02_41_11]
MAEEDISQLIHASQGRSSLSMPLLQSTRAFFEGQEKGEHIILMLRPHVITLAPPAFVALILFLAPFYIIPFLKLINIDLSGTLNFMQTFLIIIIWYLFVFGYSLYHFIFWYFNIYILTNERIIDFDFKGLLNKEISYAKLNQIQDISPKTIGFFGTFVHFGNVFIQTAAERPEFEFHNVARPDMVAQEILKQVRHEEGEAPGEIA